MRMRLIIFAWLLALMGVASAAPIKVVAWNLEWFPGRRQDATPEEAAQHMKQAQAALKRIKPDVLVLTEVRDLDAVKELVSVLPGFEVHIVSGFQRRHQQVAIASRYTARAAWAQSWFRPIAGPPRGFSFADLNLPGDAHLLVFGLHLKSNLGSAVIDRCMREASSLQLTAYADAARKHFNEPRTAVLFAGDFNTNLDSDKFKSDASLRLLRAAGYWWPFAPLAPEQRLSWHGAGYEPTQFDHFFSRNLGRPVASVLGYNKVSDHHPIAMTIETDDIR